MKRQAIDPFQAVGDPNRRQMLKLLSKESLTINALAENFDDPTGCIQAH